MPWGADHVPRRNFRFLPTGKLANPRAEGCAALSMRTLTAPSTTSVQCSPGRRHRPERANYAQAGGEKDYMYSPSAVKYPEPGCFVAGNAFAGQIVGFCIESRLSRPAARYPDPLVAGSDEATNHAQLETPSPSLLREPPEPCVHLSIYLPI